MPRLAAAAAVAVTLAVLLVAAGGYLASTHGVAVPGIGAKLRSPDGRVTLDIPWGAESPGTDIVFRTDAGAAGTLASARGFSPLGSPVDVAVTRGGLRPGQVRVTFAYDPSALPRGVTPTNLGLAMFDPNLDGWVAILSASVDASRHTISAVAPHFSLFSAIFLDPAKRVVSVAGRAIHTVIDGGITVARWTAEFFEALVKSFVGDLTGATPPMSCSPVSQDLIASATALLDGLTACVQASAGTETLRLRNAFAFPVRTGRFPAGIALSAEDVLANGSDLVTLLRGAFYAIQHEAVVAGSNLGAVTVTSAMQTTATLDLDLDLAMVAEDVIIAFALVYAPEESLLRAGIEDAVKSLLTVGTVSPGRAGTPSALITHVFDALDCAVTGSRTGLEAPPLSRKWLEESAEIAKTCLGALLDALNLQSALADLLGVVKIVPETLEASAAQVFSVALPTSTHFTVTVKRFDVRAAVAPYVDTWGGHSRQLVIRADGSGTLEYRDYDSCPIPLPEVFTICDIVETLRFGAGADGLVAVVVDSHAEAGGALGAYGFHNGTTYRFSSTASDVVSLDGAAYCRGQAEARGDCGA